MGVVKARPTVALLVETSNRYSRELLRGIRAYMREHPSWAIHLSEQGRGATPPAWLAHWRGDGIIARIETAAIAKAVTEAGVPVVNVSAAGLAPAFPAVISDSVAIARTAAEHLMDRGFRYFAYCGDARFAWSKRHEENFLATLDDAGHSAVAFRTNPRDFANWAAEHKRLRRWISELPKPLGIMTCYDIRGQQVLDACRELGLRVPDEVGVIGQHNDDLLCELCDPPLSSVIPNARRAGYVAAEMLGHMMKGRQVPAKVTALPPVGVATRQSTDVVALDDRQIAEAVRFIRRHACENISVSDVLRAVPMSRTLLERKFQKLLKRTPASEIIACRIRAVGDLLATTTLTVAEIAERTGFSSPEYLSAAFRRETGRTPRDHRRAHAVAHG